MQSKPTTILVVDDEVSVTDMLYEDLTGEGYDCITASTGGDALQKLSLNKTDVALLDLRLPDLSGMEVLEKIKSTHSETAVIIITGYGDIETAVEALKIGATDFIIKPFKLDKVNRSIATALDMATSTKSASAPAGNSSDMIGEETGWVRYLNDIACGVETKLDSQTVCLMRRAVIERTVSIARNLCIPEHHVKDWADQRYRHIERINTLDVIMDKLRENALAL